MTEPTNEQEQTTEAQDTVTEAGNDKDYAKLEKLFRDATKREARYKEQFEALKKAQEDAATQAEKKKLEAAGQYEQLLKNAQADFDKKLSDYQNQIIKRDFRDRLRNEAKSGDEIFFDWAVDRFQGTPEDFQSFIDGLKNDAKTAKHFQEPAAASTPGHIPPAPAAARGGAQRMTLEDRLKSDDPKVKLEALKEQFQQAVR